MWGEFNVNSNEKIKGKIIWLKISTFKLYENKTISKTSMLNSKSSTKDPPITKDLLICWPLRRQFSSFRGVWKEYQEKTLEIFSISFMIGNFLLIRLSRLNGRDSVFLWWRESIFLQPNDFENKTLQSNQKVFGAFLWNKLLKDQIFGLNWEWLEEQASFLSWNLCGTRGFVGGYGTLKFRFWTWNQAN